MRTKKAIKFGITGLTVVAMLLFFAMDWAVVYDSSRLILFLYAFVMCACLLSVANMMIKPVRKISVILLLISFGLYIAMYNFVPEIVQAHRIDTCLDNGGMWNNTQNQCQ